jgi:hypothetical protein
VPGEIGDRYDPAARGIYGTFEDARRDALQFLGRYADRLIEPEYPSASIRAR